MFVIDTEKRSESQWRTYKPGVRVKVAPIDRPKYNALQRRAKVVAKQTGEDVTACFDRLFCELVIEEWDGFVTPDGAPIPCTKSNIAKVADRLNEWVVWVAGESLSLEENVAAERAETLKK